jgi:hypothetical protein
MFKDRFQFWKAFKVITLGGLLVILSIMSFPVYSGELFDREQKYPNIVPPKFTLGSYGFGKWQLLEPIRVTIDNDELIYLSECGNNRIQVFDPEGNYLKEWGNYGYQQGKFVCPAGVTIESLRNKGFCGKLWVCLPMKSPAESQKSSGL